jgi:UDP-N-acetylmuramoylalanine--D-glutamate ligase
MEADSLKEAVRMSRTKAKRGEIVLLSPACASFDMFENYEHRGNEFKEAVMEL